MDFISEMLDTRCKVCDKRVNYKKIICEECEKSIFNPSLTRNNIVVYHFGLYVSPLSDIIKTYKYHSFVNLSKFFGIKMADYFYGLNLEIRDYYITYVPSNFISRYKKGFTPARLIAKEFSKITGLKFIDLFKINSIKRQVGLSSEERKNNIRGKIKITTIIPENLIIIDDVYTTGSTMNELYSITNGYCKNLVGLTVAKAKGDAL